MLDVLIIGCGPAGSSAAIYLKRFNIDVTVISNGESTLKTAHKIENYYGTGSLSGTELYENGLKQLQDLGVNVLNESVVAIEYYSHFVVTTTKGVYEAKKVILATGKARNMLKVKNSKNYEMKGLSYCATCDGFFYRNQRIGLYGSGNQMLHELAFLKNISNDITVFTDGVELEIDGVKVVTEKVLELFGSEFLEGVITTDNTYFIDGLFVAIGEASTFDFIKHLGIATDKNNNIIVNENYQTNIPNLYAVGDAIGGVLQIAKCVYDGMKVSYSIFNEGKKA